MFNWSKRSAEPSRRSQISEPGIRSGDLERVQAKLGDRLAESVHLYLVHNRCRLILSRPRKSKFGDFRALQGTFSISVNRDLNPYRFALTLFHELAHLHTYSQFKGKVHPHGPEWKASYREMLDSYGVEQLFQRDPELHAVYQEERNNPRAQAGLHGIKEEVLGRFDPPDHRSTLLELPEGQRFTFRGKEYIKLKEQRSRALCIRTQDQRKYTISLSARVEIG